MASRTFHFKGFSVAQGDVKVNVSLSRFEKQFEKAQFALDNAVMTSMVPFMPMQTGNFIQRTRAMSEALAGSGVVVAAAPPMGRYLYEGKVMVDEVTGSPWARLGAKKVVTDRNLEYFTGANPKAQAHWFDAAKAEDLKDWVNLTKRIAGGGTDG